MNDQICVLLYGVKKQEEAYWLEQMLSTHWQLRRCETLETLLWYLQEDYSHLVVIDLDDLDDVMPHLESPVLLLANEPTKFQDLDTSRFFMFDLLLKPYGPELLLFRLNRLAQEYKSQTQSWIGLNQRQWGSLEEDSGQFAPVRRMLMQVAHDLKSPLFGFAAVGRRLLDHELNLQPAHQELLESALTGLNQLSSQIDHLLDKERFVRGQLNIRLQELNIYQLVEEVIGGLRVPASLKKIQIINQIPKHLKLFTDRMVVTAVLNNLLQNAVKYCRSGNRVHIATCPSSLGSLLVSDDGPGLSAPNQCEIAGAKQPPGHGLGLSYCCELLTLLGGELQLVNSSPQGTTFQVNLLPVGSGPLLSQTTIWDQVYSANLN